MRAMYNHRKYKSALAIEHSIWLSLIRFALMDNQTNNQIHRTVLIVSSATSSSKYIHFCTPRTKPLIVVSDR